MVAMERIIRRALCLVMGGLVIAGLLLLLAGATGMLQGAPAIDVLWRLSGMGALAVGALLGAVAVGLMRTHPLGVRILEGLVSLLGLGLLASVFGASAEVVPMWSPLVVGLALVGSWGLWLGSQLVELDRWRR